MASALIKGMLASGYSPQQLLVTDADVSKAVALASSCGITVCVDNQALVNKADIVVLAVKPQVMETVVATLAPTLASHSCLLISVAAGIPLVKFTDWSHAEQAVVRCMPNTPALVGEGASALYANANCHAAQCEEAEAILKAVGIVVWVENETQMDAVTALSGSGPAYFFLLIEAMQEAAIKLGLPDEIATTLSLQTALGAASLAKSSDISVAELRHRVTSAGGTTEAALHQFESDDFRHMVERALGKAAKRSRELAE